MRTFCPRCEHVLTPRSQECPQCGYHWHVKCGLCGKLNPPASTFCGGCGQGLSWKTRTEQRFRKFLPPAHILQAKELMSGFIFGGILFLFAFGTMGMSNPGFSRPEPVAATCKIDNPFQTEVARKAFESFKKISSRETHHREATHADLVRIGNILIETFSPAIDPEGRNLQRQALADSLRYLQSMENSEEDLSDIPLKRSDVAIFLYRMIGEMFEVSAPDQVAYHYTDLPKYHYMNLPVEMLDAFGLKLAREAGVFGSEDVVSLEWLSGLSIDLIRSCEARLKPTATPGLQTSR